MAAIGRRRSLTSSLATPGDRSRSKSPSVSSTSLASDAHNNTNNNKSRSSDDARSDTSGSTHRTRMSRMFKGRSSKRTPSASLSGNAPPESTAHARDDSHTDDNSTAPRPPLSPSYSQESLGLAKSVTSSLLTDDSDPDSSPLRRPGISPHHSHAGLLTLSSPLIASETLDSSISSATETDATLVDSATTPHNPQPQHDSLSHAQTFDVAAAKRGTSPVGKLKEAFSPQRRSTSPKTVTDSDPPRPSSSTNLGTLFGGKKRDTSVLGEPFQASPPQIVIESETGSTSSLRSKAPAKINTQFPATPPNLVDAPTTFVTPPTPVDAHNPSPTGSTHSAKASKHSPSQSNPNVTVSPSGNMISHRRVRSASNAPSKLSNIISAPLTPHPEEAKTPGGTAVSPPQTGFFSSVFSAAQNAANTFSNTIANNAGGKNKPSQQPKEEEPQPEDGGEEVIGPASADPTASGDAQRRPAIETLGSGNLSLAHLGISESSDVSPMSSATNITTKADEASAKVEDKAAAQAVSAAYAADQPPPTQSERPRSLTANSLPAPGAASPTRQPNLTDSPASIQRQGSIRSRISGGRRRRHRGSSAATGTTIATALGASTATLAPNAALTSQRLNGTGFAVAPPKRNKDFHALFKSVPEDDYLIEDYSAALQKEILLHGRLYVSEGHLCFSSNILGWVTNLVISFDEVVSVEKKSTAVLFPNAIVIQTLHARNVFASFLARDSTYDLIIGIWKISHPNLKSSLNGVALDKSGGTGDKTEKAESVGSDVGSIDSDDEVYDEDADDDDGVGSFTEAGEGSVAGSDMGSVAGDTRKVSGAVAQAVGGGGETIEATKATTNAAASTNDFPGMASHGPTECGDSDKHYDKLLIDTTIPAPLGKVYSLMFGPAADVFMRKWLIEDQKSMDLQMEPDKDGLGEKKKSFSYSYIKPLSAPVGPRQTKCNIDMQLEQFDLEKAVSVQCSTQTPDVPSGSIFLTKTRYCLMWGPGDSTRLIMTFTVEWSGKSWLKGPIEKGANDGQMQYATALTAALRTAVSAKAPLRTPGKGGKGKKRSKTQALDEAPILAPSAPVPQNKPSNWGILEPIHSFVPFADTIEGIFTPQVIIAVLGALLVYAWFFRAGPTAISGPNSWTSAQRQVAYEEIWRREETELWGWLEDRVALDRVHVAASSSSSRSGESWAAAGKQADASQAPLRVKDMPAREIDEALRVTELRLQELKDAVDRERRLATKSAKEQV